MHRTIEPFPISILSEDGLEAPPQGVYFQKGEWLKAAHFNARKFKRGYETSSPFLDCRGHLLNEKRLHKAKKRGAGGVLVLEEGRELGLKDLFQALKESRVTGACLSTGRFFFGRYLAKNEARFSSASFSIDCIGVSRDKFLKYAKVLSLRTGGSFLLREAALECWSYIEG